jgi:hypothetical protein
MGEVKDINLKLTSIIFKNSVPALQKTHSNSTMKTDQLMLYNEIITEECYILR